MIKLKKMQFSNLFSYGNDNVVQFDANPITQLVGKNGHGKTSIPLVLEEVLYNKNSKGIKKADILNRYVKDKSYSIELEFEKDGESYLIKTNRGSTQTVSLFHNTDNISAHTATATFKLIEDVLGFDHRTFSQLVYQSSSSSLEFLTATDTNRKKFLIDLLNLSRYTEAFEVFKAASKELSEAVTKLESKLQTTQAWLTKHESESLDLLPLEGVPVYLDNPEQDIGVLQAEESGIVEKNKRIAKNNLLMQQFSNISIEDLAIPVPPVEDPKPLILEQGSYDKAAKDAAALISKIGKLNGTCPTCLQPVNREMLDQLVAEQQAIISDAEAAIIKLANARKVIDDNKREADRLTKLKSDYETLHASIDRRLPSEPLNPDEIAAKLKVLKKIVDDRKRELAVVEEHNRKASAHNARVQLITSQMDEMKSSIDGYSQELFTLNERLSILQILQKTFSTSGLIAYKIECMVKDLEDLANEYLADLSGGRFQLMFKVATGDKLNVVITDNGRDIDILALSGGERARVNTATLLAIRKLMQSLSNARINLLILDETIDALDLDGKEKLVEVLLKEEHLNTFLVSHGFTHPLLEKITVIKEQNISRLE